MRILIRNTYWSTSLCLLNQFNDRDELISLGKQNERQISWSEEMERRQSEHERAKCSDR